ncbi:MAG: hypothetical protein FRX49_05680 [Trebouxia sp. A1-2]|nr:MAG: hypothetical protein FRX49_05680 [Trebouxia sp. A1-2]
MQPRLVKDAHQETAQDWTEHVDQAVKHMPQPSQTMHASGLHESHCRQNHVCHGSQNSSTLAEEFQPALTGNSELTLAIEMKGGWVEMTVAAMYTAASSQAHASKTCKAHQRPCTQHKVTDLHENIMMRQAVRLAGSAGRQPASVTKMRRVNGAPYNQSHHFSHTLEFACEVMHSHQGKISQAQQAHRFFRAHGRARKQGRESEVQARAHLPDGLLGYLELLSSICMCDEMQLQVLLQHAQMLSLTWCFQRLAIREAGPFVTGSNPLNPSLILTRLNTRVAAYKLLQANLELGWSGWFNIWHASFYVPHSPAECTGTAEEPPSCTNHTVLQAVSLVGV